jgi:hypothetical protein
MSLRNPRVAGGVNRAWAGNVIPARRSVLAILLGSKSDD